MRTLRDRWGSTLHSARMSPAQFWTAVDQARWGQDYGYDRIKDFFLERFSQEETEAFRETFNDLKRALGDELSQWAKDEDKSFNLGDDSWGDLLAHIIGLGKREYEATMRDPSRALNRERRGDYKESFVYSIPYPGDYKKMAPPTPAKEDGISLFGGWAIPDPYRKGLLSVIDAEMRGLNQLQKALQDQSALQDRTGNAFRKLGKWAEDHRAKGVPARDYYDWISQDFSLLMHGRTDMVSEPEAIAERLDVLKRIRQELLRDPPAAALK